MKEVLICCKLQKQVFSCFHSFSNLSNAIIISLTFFVVTSIRLVSQKKKKIKLRKYTLSILQQS